MDRQQFEMLAKQCAASVHHDTLAAVIQTESSFNPLAINVNGNQKLPRQPANLAEAIATAEHLSENSYSFDAGLGQINSANVAAFNMPWEDVFEPCANLAAAARVLTECFVRAEEQDNDPQNALRLALSCYNTGSFHRGRQNGYVARVERSAGIVPALMPPSAGSVDVENTSADAFGRSRPDAFGRATISSQVARVVHSPPPGNHNQ